MSGGGGGGALCALAGSFVKEVRQYACFASVAAMCMKANCLWSFGADEFVVPRAPVHVHVA